MMSLSKYKITTLISIILSLGSELNCMQAPTPSLSQSGFKAAAVLPFTRWKSKKNGGNAYFLLSREKNGRDAGTYDTWGGKRDAGEKHPVVTAGREFAEEALFILGSPGSITNYIDLKNNHTKYVICRNSKQYVTYITKYSTFDLEKLAKEFYRKMNHQQTKVKSEKDALRWVKWADLEKAIANSTPGQFPVTVKAAKVNKKTGRLLKDKNGKTVTEIITLRPILVSMMRPLFTHQQYIQGKNAKIRFYS